MCTKQIIRRAPHQIERASKIYLAAACRACQRRSLPPRQFPGLLSTKSTITRLLIWLCKRGSNRPGGGTSAVPQIDAAECQTVATGQS